MVESKVKYGLYVQTTKKNYAIEIISTVIYMLLFSMIVSQKSTILVLGAPIMAVFFLRFVEYHLTGIAIEFAFTYQTGNIAKFSAYVDLIIAIGALVFFAFF